MAKTPFSAKKHDINTLNSGYQYTTDDQMSIEALNNTIENSFYASNIAENVANQLSNLDPNEKIEFKGSNPNLLINGDFRVNQRGASGTQSGNSKFPVDRWKTSALNAFCTTNLDTNGNVESVVAGITGVTTTGGRNALIYNFEDKDFKKLLGKQVTLSIDYQELNADVANSVRIRYDSGVDNGAKVLTETSGIAILTFTVNPNATKLVIQIAGTSSALNYSLKLNWAKLEVGEIATPFVPRPYAEELALCQRYYQCLRIDCACFLASENAIYPNVNLVTTLRTYPTIIVKTYPSVRGEGAIVGNLTNLKYSGLYNNILLLNSNPSDIGVVVKKIYMVTNGLIEADAEIY